MSTNQNCANTVVHSLRPQANRKLFIEIRHFVVFIVVWQEKDASVHELQLFAGDVIFACSATTPKALTAGC